jgi:PAS domain S-box-containing protein
MREHRRSRGERVGAINEGDRGARTLSDVAAAEAADLERRYRLLLDHVPAIVYVWNVHAGTQGPSGPQGEVSEMYVSPRIEQVLGYPPEAWWEDPGLWVEMLHPEDREDVLRETERAVEAGESFSMVYRMIARDGRIVWLQDEADVLARDDRGRALRYQGVEIDITRQREADAELRRRVNLIDILSAQRHQLMTRLVDAQDHERRRIAESIRADTMQVLARVSMSLDVVSRRHPEPDEQERLRALEEDVVGAAGRLRRLTFRLNPLTLDVSGLEAAFRERLQGWISGPPTYEIDVRLATEPESVVRSALYRIADEALSNVEKHAEASRVSVSLREQDDGWLMRVEDDGVGFDPTLETPSSLERFGVRSMAERAELAGGWCRIESEPGHGTVVECWLPAGGAAAPETASSVERPAGAAAAPTHATDTYGLTPREIEVAQLLALGHTNQEIAAILYVSVRTIEHHRANVLRKIGVRSRAGLVRWLRDHPLPD